MMRGPAAAILVAMLAAGAARAAPGCAIPQPLDIPRAELPSADQPSRQMPITGYKLALIWAPQHCVDPVPGVEWLRCGPGLGSRFVLHGLWPDGVGGSWPQYCTAAAILPPKVIAHHYCDTPSAQLLQHEWAKHGTCMPGLDPQRFFALSHRLYAALRWPDMARLAAVPQDDRSFAAAFAAANPPMRPDMVRPNLNRQGWLQEVWLCLDRRLRRTACAGPNRPPRTVRIRL